MNAQKTKDNGQYVSLPFFGLPKILKYIRKYRSWIAIMVTCGVLASVGDIAIPFFRERLSFPFCATSASSALTISRRSPFHISIRTASDIFMQES